MTPLRRAVLVASTLALASCASRVPVAPTRPSLPVPSTADDSAALIRKGCYRCLEEAFAAAQRNRAAAAAFEAAALLVLRSKELGLPHDGWLEEARKLAAGGAATILAILEAIPPHPLSGDPDGVVNFSGRIQARTSLGIWREALQKGSWSEPFRAYLDLSLVCSFGRVVEDERSFSGPADPVAATPLYQYRLGICDSTQAPRLADFRARNDDYVEADFALGAAAFENPVNPDQEEGLRRLQSAAAAFPRSPAIATTVGNVYRAWEEWSAALEAYDRALEVSPDHPEALIGRTISLSRLSRPDEAIETATRVIDAARWRLGEAYYWRGWNHLVRGDHQRAREDTDRARKLMMNAAVFVLSGAIEWRLGRRQSAEQDFAQALLIDLGECEAASNLGVVRGELGRVPEALAAFTQARQCYDLSIALRQDAIARIRAGPGNQVTNARAAALHERALQDFRTRRDEVLRSMEALQKRTREREDGGNGVHAEKPSAQRQPSGASRQPPGVSPLRGRTRRLLTSEILRCLRFSELKSVRSLDSVDRSLNRPRGAAPFKESPRAEPSRGRAPEARALATRPRTTSGRECYRARDCRCRQSPARDAWLRSL